MVSLSNVLPASTLWRPRTQVRLVDQMLLSQNAAGLYQSWYYHVQSNCVSPDLAVASSGLIPFFGGFAHSRIAHGARVIRQMDGYRNIWALWSIGYTKAVRTLPSSVVNLVRPPVLQPSRGLRVSLSRLHVYVFLTRHVYPCRRAAARSPICYMSCYDSAVPVHTQRESKDTLGSIKRQLIAQTS